MFKTFQSFLADEQGATAIEYAMIAAFIVLAIVAILPLLGDKVEAMFLKINNSFNPS